MGEEGCFDFFYLVHSKIIEYNNILVKIMTNLTTTNRTQAEGAVAPYPLWIRGMSAVSGSTPVTQ